MNSIFFAVVLGMLSDSTNQTSDNPAPLVAQKIVQEEKGSDSSRRLIRFEPKLNWESKAEKTDQFVARVQPPQEEDERRTNQQEKNRRAIAEIYEDLEEARKQLEAMKQKAAAEKKRALAAQEQALSNLRKAEEAKKQAMIAKELAEVQQARAEQQRVMAERQKAAVEKQRRVDRADAVERQRVARRDAQSRVERESDDDDDDQTEEIEIEIEVGKDGQIEVEVEGGEKLGPDTLRYVIQDLTRRLPKKQGQGNSPNRIMIRGAQQFLQLHQDQQLRRGPDENRNRNARRIEIHEERKNVGRQGPNRGNRNDDHPNRRAPDHHGDDHDEHAHHQDNHDHDHDHEHEHDHEIHDHDHEMHGERHDQPRRGPDRNEHERQVHRGPDRENHRNHGPDERMPNGPRPHQMNHRPEHRIGQLMEAAEMMERLGKSDQAHQLRQEAREIEMHQSRNRDHGAHGELVDRFHRLERHVDEMHGRISRIEEQLHRLMEGMERVHQHFQNQQRNNNRNSNRR